MQTWWPRPRRPAVDHDRHGLPSSRPNARAAVRVVDLVDVLHLGEVVAGAERAELIGAALEGAVRDLRRVGAVEAAALFERLEIARLAEPALDRPRRASPQHRAELVAAEMLVARPRPTPVGMLRIERVDQRATSAVLQIVAAEIERSSRTPQLMS